MVKIRLRRMGAKKKPFYRIVVADSKSPRDGRFIEELGTYNPLIEPSEIKLNLERAKYWISNGAQPTDTVKRLLKSAEAASTVSTEPTPVVGAPAETAAAQAETATAPELTVTSESKEASESAEEPSASGEAVASAPSATVESATSV